MICLSKNPCQTAWKLSDAELRENLEEVKDLFFVSVKELLFKTGHKLTGITVSKDPDTDWVNWATKSISNIFWLRAFLVDHIKAHAYKLKEFKYVEAGNWATVELEMALNILKPNFTTTKTTPTNKLLKQK